MVQRFRRKHIMSCLVIVSTALMGGASGCGQQPTAELNGNLQSSIELVDLELCRKQDTTNEVEAVGFLSFLPPDSFLCRGKPDLLRVFEGVGVAFGAMTVVCSFPGIMQIGMPVSAIGSAASSIIAFGLKGVNCEDPSPTLTPMQEQIIESRICDLMGKRYLKGLGPSDHSRCI